MLKPSQTLAERHSRRLEQFLMDSANVRLETGAVRRFIKRFPDFDLCNERVFSALFTKPSTQGVIYPSAERATKISKKYPLLATWDPERMFYVDDTGDRG